MKKLFIKEFKNRKIFLKNYLKKQCLKAIHANEKFSLQYRYTAFKILITLPKISISTLKNRCIFTNRSKGVESKFKLSRIMIRKLISLGLISQLQKSSW